MGFYLSGFHIDAMPQFSNQPVSIAFPPEDGEPFAHLLLTGPNGSGKSTILNLLAEAISYRMRARVLHGCRLDWLETFHDRDQLERATADGLFVSAHLGAMRKASIQRVNGPKSLALGSMLPQEQVGSQFLQLLVNRKAEQGFAAVDGDEVKAKALRDWFDNLLHHLRELLAEPGLELVFDSKEFNFYLRHPDGRRYDFTQLADGHAAVLSIYAELLLRLENIPGGGLRDPHLISGIVFIDELETHLHLELQEKILPFLTGVFPYLQMIIATHSPVILSSVDNAVIYDLESRRTVRSKEFQAIPYGTLMKEHFGIESDFDLASTQQLRELQILNEKQVRLPEEDEKLQLLVNELLPTGHPIVLEVWNRLQFPELYSSYTQVRRGSGHD